jgi:hypothetical protein
VNQHRIWSDPKIRAERQAAVRRLTGRPMELDPIDAEPATAAEVLAAMGFPVGGEPRTDKEAA